MSLELGHALELAQSIETPMKIRDGGQGYNCQAVADCSSQVIVSQDSPQQENDVRQLKPMLERCEEQAGERPKSGVLDAGYWSEDNAQAGGNTEFYIATLKDHKQRKAIKEQQASRGRKPKGMSSIQEMERKLLTKEKDGRFLTFHTLSYLFKPPSE